MEAQSNGCKNCRFFEVEDGFHECGNPRFARIYRGTGRWSRPLASVAARECRFIYWAPKPKLIQRIREWLSTLL